jgi:hypothetical protein
LGFVEIPGCHFIPSSNQTVAGFLTEIFGFVEILRCHFIPSYNQTVPGFLTEVFQYCICNHHKMKDAVIVQSFIGACKYLWGPAIEGLSHYYSDENWEELSAFPPSIFYMKNFKLYLWINIWALGVDRFLMRGSSYSLLQAEVIMQRLGASLLAGVDLMQNALKCLTVSDLNLIL